MGGNERSAGSGAEGAGMYEKEEGETGREGTA